MARFVARRSKSLSSYGEGLTCYSRSGADEPATILVVDDRDANLLALEAVLEPLQQRLVRARSGREALRFLLEEDCALILLDVQMPEVDGFETAALIRERERNRYTPIIFVTAVSREEEHILKGYAKGAVDYVVKPFTPETMIAKVRIFLDQHRREEGLKREAIMRSQERDEFERRENDSKHQLRILHAIGASTPDFTCLFDRAHRFLYVSPALLKIWGRTLDEAVGKNFEELGYPPELIELYRRQLDDALTGKTVSGANAYVSPQGVEGHYEYTFVPVFGEDGRVETIAGTTRDITERVKAERERALIVQRLTESEAQFRHFADAMPQLAWIARADGFTYWYNKRWYEYTGTTPAQMEGWGWQSVHDPRELPRVLEGWRASINTGEPFEMTFPLQGADHRFRWFLTRVNPVRSSRGEVHRWFGTNTDIDAQKQALAERDAALAEAEKAVRIREEFLSIASHELKTPLTSLRLQLQMTRRSVKSEEGVARPADTLARSLGLSLKQVTRLTNLVEDLLDVARIGTGKLPLTFADVDLTEMVAEVLERHRDQLQAARCAVEFRPEQRVRAECDRFRMEQVVSNLLENAAKYAAGKPVQIWLSEVGDSALIHVRDFGIGIARKDRGRIFERFERAAKASEAHGV